MTNINGLIKFYLNHYLKSYKVTDCENLDLVCFI